MGKFGDESFSVDVVFDPDTALESNLRVTIAGHEFAADVTEHRGVVASGLIEFQRSTEVRNWAPFWDLNDSPDLILNRFTDLLWRADRLTITHASGVNMAMVQYQFDRIFDNRLGLGNDGTLIAIRCPIDRTETFLWTRDGQQFSKAEVPAKSVDRTLTALLAAIEEHDR